MHDPVMGDKYTPAVGNDGNFIANVNDDDGAILDSLVSSEAEPPKPDELPIVRIDMRPVPTKVIPAPQRMRASTFNVAQRVPILIANANPHRVELYIDCNINTGAATLWLASTRTDVQNPITAYGMWNNAYASANYNYTGELWAMYDGVTPEGFSGLSVMEIITQEVGR